LNAGKIGIPGARGEVGPVAWATTLGPDARQVDYRLQENAGCGLTADQDGQVTYRLDSDRPLEWVGEGLREVGIEPGTVLDDAAKEAARQLADGRDPHTGARLITPKKAVDPRAKLDAAPLVDAVRAAAERAGTTPALLLGQPRAVARFGRLQRGVASEQGRADARAEAGITAAVLAHKAPVAELEKVAEAAGLSLDDLYDAGALAVAREHKNARVVVGNRGYDLTLDLPKSYSVLVAMADPGLARELEDAYLDCVRETVTAVEKWAGYAMRGHHGDGRSAQRVEGTGLLGWMTVHRTARPVGGAAPDPHLHAHVTFVNMVRAAEKLPGDDDRQWNTMGAGGRDVRRHVKAAGTLMQARLRAVTRERWGIEWARDARTGAWEIVGVPAGLRQVFSKRQGQIDAALTDRGLDRTQATTAQIKLAAQQSKRAKNPAAAVDLRADWHAQAVAAKASPAGVVAAAMPGPQPEPEPTAVPIDDLAAWVFRDETGLTAHRKTVTRADVLAEVLDADPAGISSLAEAEQLVDQVLAGDLAVPLPATGAVHLTNAQRYTSADVVDAERTVLGAARDRFAGGYAVVDEHVTALAVAQFEAAAGFALSAEQRAVLDRLTGAGHGVDTVIGVAGSGKTTLMSALRTAYEATGQTVEGASTAAVAAANLQTEAGITSRTIASWLHRLDTGQGLHGVGVLVVDEAAMVDDRSIARLLQAAGQSGTKVVMIGDPKQLKAIGIGGTFAAVHTLIGGLELTENRRQRDLVERAALAVWRTDERRAALQAWADSGRVHVTTTPEEAHAAILDRWASARTAWTDPHDRIEQLLMLAHTNADVDALNHGAQQQRQAAGELGIGATWQLATGGRLRLHVGDQVMTRTNDRGIGVLNGQRGVVTAIDEHGTVTIQRRDAGPDGPVLEETAVPVGYVQQGGVQLAYALTAAKAQGLTSTAALVYGNGMDANVIYPAMSRDRLRADLWLALEPLESDEDRARLGAPDGEAEARQRAVDAYAAAVKDDRPDGIVLAELGEAPAPIVAHPTGEPRPQPGPGPRREPVADVDALAARLAAIGDEQLRQPTDRDRLLERLRAARLGPAGRRAADEQARREVMAELRAIAAGEDPSGRYTRAQLQDGLAVVRAEMARREREAALAAGGRAEHVPAGATGGHLPWQQRPHGKLTDAQLAAAIREADKVITRTQHDLQERLVAAVEQLAAATAGRGPAALELTADRDRLTAAADAGVTLAQARQDAQAAARAAEQARALARQLREQQGRHPLRLLLAGTNRTELGAQRDEVLRQVRHHDQAEAAALARARQAEPIVVATPDAAARLADLQQVWPDRLAEAIATDVTAARQLPDGPGITRTREHAAGWQRRGAALHTEAALRESLDPVIARVEEVSRNVELTRERIDRLDRQRTAGHGPDSGYDYYRDHHPDPHIDHGPSMGL
jgi:conjugative relaxase-like TrwC/TraI family protein